MKQKTCVTLLLLASALPCFAQGSQPSEPEFGALPAFEREIEAATARVSGFDLSADMVRETQADIPTGP